MPTRRHLTTLHAASGAVALITITVFWLATAGSLLLLDGPGPATVKSAIAWGLCLLLPALIAAGVSGAGLARGRQGAAIARKMWRMRIAGGLGVGVLVPCALALAQADALGLTGTAYGAVQTAELAAGAVNIMLLGANMRDGLALGRARRGVRSDREARPAAAG